MSGNLDGGKSSGLFETSDGNFYGLIGLQRVVFESIQLVIVKNRPPLAFAECVLRSAFAPRFSDVPMSGSGRTGALIFRAYSAAGNAKDC